MIGLPNSILIVSLGKSVLPLFQTTINISVMPDFLQVRTASLILAGDSSAEEATLVIHTPFKEGFVVLVVVSGADSSDLQPGKKTTRKNKRR